MTERVIEVFDCFAALNRPVTVMDIVYRYGRPQSSTSDLLKSLVQMGVLYRDPAARSYAPTPRLAVMSRALQPEPVGSGRLFAYMERLAQAARCGVGLFGMVGTEVQLVHWVDGASPAKQRLAGGAAARLSSSAAGLLLLSGLGTARASKLLWRLHAEAASDRERFDLAEAKRLVSKFGQHGRGIGPSGFAADTSVAAILLPGLSGDRSLALGAIYRSDESFDPHALLAKLDSAARADFLIGAAADPLSVAA